jgi:putative transposase
VGFAYNFKNKDGIYFISCAVVQWVDAFTRSYYCDIVVNSLKYCIDNKGLVLYAWVIMPNHIHLIISRKGEPTLSDIMRDFKKHTSTQIIEAIKAGPESRRDWMLWIFSSAGKANPQNTNFQFWQQDNHPEELFSTKFIKQKVEYLHENPAKAMIVDTPERYIYSSARDYAGESGLLPVTILNTNVYIP